MTSYEPMPSNNLEFALLRERMEVMFWQEVAQYGTADYLNFTTPAATAVSDSEGIMSEQWRTRMCEWAYQLVDHFDFPRHIVGNTMNLLDRYLAKYFTRLTSTEGCDGIPRITKKQFQLITMCCLYLAMKINGTSTSYNTTATSCKIPIQYMVQLSRGAFCEEELVATEREILSTLGWLVNPTTSYDFLKHYLELLRLQHNQGSQPSASANPRMTALEDLASFLVELSVLDYYFVNFRPSTVAVAALLNAMDEDPVIQATAIGFGNNPFFPVQSHTLYYGLEGLILQGQEEAVYLCRQRLGSLYQNANTSGVEDTDNVAEPASPTPQATANDKDQRITSPVSVMASGVVTATTATAAHEMNPYHHQYHYGS